MCARAGDCTHLFSIGGYGEFSSLPPSRWIVSIMDTRAYIKNDVDAARIRVDYFSNNNK